MVVLVVWSGSGADNRFFASSPSFLSFNVPICHSLRDAVSLLKGPHQLSPPLPAPRASPSPRQSPPPPAPRSTNRAHGRALTRPLSRFAVFWHASEIGNQIGWSFRSQLLHPLGQLQLCAISLGGRIKRRSTASSLGFFSGMCGMCSSERILVVFSGLPTSMDHVIKQGGQRPVCPA